jgi:hypothetical protein
MLFSVALIACEASNNSDEKLVVQDFESLNISSTLKFNSSPEKSEISSTSEEMFIASRNRQIDELRIEVDFISPALKFSWEYDELNNENREAYLEYLKKSFFQIKISIDKASDPLKSDLLVVPYDKAVHYLTASIQNDLGIEKQSGELVKPEMVVFERSFGTRPYLLVNMIFEKEKIQDSKKFVYNDRLFGKGIVKLDFSELNKDLVL